MPKSKVQVKVINPRTEAWKKQQVQCFQLRRLHEEQPENVFGMEAIKEAFDPLTEGDTLYVCCSDERCGSGYEPETRFHRFASPGTFVLCDASKGELDYACSFLSGLKEKGVHIVPARHEGCGACGYKCKLDAEKGIKSTPDDVGEQAAERVCELVHLDEEPLTMGYSDGCEVHMRGDSHFHDARKMIVDLSNEMTNPSLLGICPAFQMNRYTNDTAKLIADIKLLLSIAMDAGHAFGREEFKRDKFIIMVVGVKGDKVFSSESFGEVLEKELGDLSDAVEVVGFDAPVIR